MVNAAHPDAARITIRRSTNRRLGAPNRTLRVSVLIGLIVVLSACNPSRPDDRLSVESFSNIQRHAGSAPPVLNRLDHGRVLKYTS